MHNLFDKEEISVPFAEAKKLALERVAKISQEQFLQSTDQELLAHILGSVQIRPIILMEDARDPVKYEEGRKMVPDGFGGTEEISTLRVRLRYPYDGEDYLWNCRPSPYSTTPPVGQLEREGNQGLETFVVVEFERPTDEDPSAYEAAINGWLANVRAYLKAQRDMIESFYQREFPDAVQRAISRRRDVLRKHAATLRRLNIELKRAPGAPEPVRVPMQRRVIKPPPPLPNAPAQATIRDEDYEHILNVLRHAGRTFEAAPCTFAKFEEEELRYVMLAHLNTHYQGDAGGEAFRGLGKSDIKIEFDNRAAFVAECKVWGGDKEVGQAVAQLHRYLTWRDCKTAIVIFNKSVAGFSAIQQRLPTLLAECQGFAGLVPADAGEWRCRFCSPDDPERLVTAHLFLFNLYTTPRAVKG